MVNRLEAGQIARALNIDLDEDATLLARALAHQAKLTCIITLGEHGSVAVTADGSGIRVPAFRPGHIVDTTGAGDAYCGTLAAALYGRKNLTDAMKLASVAGSLACTKRGAQDSFAYQGEIEENLERLGPVEQVAA